VPSPYPHVLCSYKNTPDAEAELSLQLRWRAVALQALHAYMLAVSGWGPCAEARVQVRGQKRERGEKVRSAACSSPWPCAEARVQVRGRKKREASCTQLAVVAQLRLQLQLPPLSPP